MDNNEFYHHGVLGMRWGIRRSLRQLSSQRKAKKIAKQRKENLAKARKSRAERNEAISKGKIKPKDMTVAELNKNIERLNLEKQYIALKKETSGQHKGKSFASKYGGQIVDKMITNVGVDLVTQLAKSAGAKGLNDLISSINSKIPEEKEKMEFVYANNKRK